jgi:hypothetical protein
MAQKIKREQNYNKYENKGTKKFDLKRVAQKMHILQY